MLTTWIHILSVTGLIGEIKTVNFGHLRDDAIIKQDDITPTDILSLILYD